MSAALNTAIYQRLTGLDNAAPAAASALAALLATDADTGIAAVYYGNKNDNAVVYPCVTYRPNAGPISRIFQDGSGPAVDEPGYDIEIWENTRNSNIIDQIADAVRALLDDRKSAKALTNGGYCYSFTTLMTCQVLYDQNSNAWFGLLRFTAVEGV